MTDFAMPSLGADMDEGTLLEWLVAPGDVVHKGDLMAVVDTAKSAVEIETFSDGMVAELLIAPGTTVPVGAVIARLDGIGAEPSRGVGTEKEPAAPKATQHPDPNSPPVRRLARELGVDLDRLAGTGDHGHVSQADVRRAASKQVPPPTPARPPANETGRPRVTPYARRLAAEVGIDPADLVAADGETVRAADVRRIADDRTAAPQPPPAAPEGGTPGAPVPDAAAKALQMREAIAKLMARSKREIPHYYLQTTVDLARAIAWMRQRNLELPLAERLVPAALLLKATAAALAKHRQLNGFWVGDAFVPGTGVHLGVAISLRGGGLVAPGLLDADRLSVDQTMAAMKDLVVRARAGRLRGSELTESTVTVTNLGDQGVEAVYGVIYPPQVALVGFGRVVERPWAVDGLLGVHPITTLTLAADHRATDGFTGSRFLSTVDDLLQHPEEL